MQKSIKIYGEISELPQFLMVRFAKRDLLLDINGIEPDFKRVKRVIWHLDVECLVGGV